MESLLVILMQQIFLSTRDFSCRPIVHALMIVLISLCPLFSQASPRASEKTFSCLVWEPLNYPEICYLDEGKYHPLEFSYGNRSQAYPLKQAKEFTLYAKTKDTNSEINHQLIGKAAIAPNSKHMLLVILPARPGDALPLKLIALDDSLEHFPPSSFKFVNFSAESYQVEFSNQSPLIPAGKMEVVKAQIPLKGGFMPFIMKNKEGKIVFETRLFAQPSGREMVFIAPPGEAGGLPKIMFLSQILPMTTP